MSSPIEDIRARLTGLKASHIPASSMPVTTSSPWVGPGLPPARVSASVGRKGKGATRAVGAPSAGQLLSAAHDGNTPKIVGPPPVQVVTGVDYAKPAVSIFKDFREQLYRSRYLGATINERSEDEL